MRNKASGKESSTAWGRPEADRPKADVSKERFIKVAASVNVNLGHAPGLVFILSLIGRAEDRKLLADKQNGSKLSRTRVQSVAALNQINGVFTQKTPENILPVYFAAHGVQLYWP
jgi:hypothetical protein